MIGGSSALQAVLVMFRDIMSIIGFFVARSVSWLRAIPFQARMLGKVVTAAQLLTFLIVLLAPSWVEAMVYIVGALGIAATIDYTLMLWRERQRASGRRTTNAPGMTERSWRCISFRTSFLLQTPLLLLLLGKRLRRAELRTSSSLQLWERPQERLVASNHSFPRMAPMTRTHYLLEQLGTASGRIFTVG